MMFYSSLRATLPALVTYTVAFIVAPPVSAAPSLTVESSISSLDADGLGNLKVTTTAVKAGEETFKPLNDTRGTLDPFPEGTFTIADPSGSRPSFSSVTINYNSTDAAGHDDPRAFTIVAPGDSINVTHGFSAAYDFTRPGTGDHPIEPSNQFTYADAYGTSEDLYATVEGIAKVKFSDDSAASRRTQDKWVDNYIDCSDEQQAELVAASKTAQQTVADASVYMQHVTFGSERYTKWFGPYDADRKEIVLETFQTISRNTNFLSYTYNCNTCERHGYHEVGGIKNIAYLRPISAPGVLFLCPRFFQLPPNGIRSKTDTLIHEATHFRENAVRGTITKDDWYGPETCAIMAGQDPETAVKNADNFAYFAINSPRLP